MAAGRNIRIQGSRNVVAEHLHIHLFPPISLAGNTTRLRALLAVLMALVLGISITEVGDHLALTGVASIAFLVSIALLFQGEKRDAAIERGVEGHLQHDIEGKRDRSRSE